MRRMPVYFLIDVSESMVGEPIRLVEDGLSTIIQTLKANPYAIETVWVSVIVFAGQAKTLVPLQEIINFYPPRFPVGSGTSLSKGLGHLMFEMRRNAVPTTYEQKGDWKPLVFLFTDGVPTDNTSAVIAEWKQHWQRKANLVAISFGSEADSALLHELTDNVLMFKNANADAYRKFFLWITDSIKTNSVSVENNSTEFKLADLDGDTLSKMELKSTPQPGYADPNYVVLSGLCQNTKRPYLMKYRKTLSPSPFMDLQTVSYRLEGAFQVDHTYTELSDEQQGQSHSINTSELIGAPTCPCCGNQVAFAVCVCDRIHCIGDEEISTCPWCSNQGHYSMGGGDFDVNRTQG